MLTSKYRQVLDTNSLNVPGLILLGHNISSKATLPMNLHIHENCLEIVVVIKGSECYYVENQKYELSGGDVFISYVNQAHRSGNSSQGVCEIIWFQINPFISENFLGLSNSISDLVRSQLLNINTHLLKADKESISYLKKSFSNFLKLEHGSKLYAQSLFICFISKLIFLQSLLKKDDPLINNVIQYIDRNIYDIINIEELCLLFNISPSGLKHKFKEFTGETPRSYINKRKIQKATELLCMGKSVTETAMILSFNSSDYFSTVFKKYLACTPSEFIAKTLYK